MAVRLFIYLVATLTVGEEHAFPLVLQVIRDAGLEILDYDEELRRVVVRAPSRLSPQLGSIIRSYARSYRIEVKASARLRADPRRLAGLGARLQRLPGGVIVFTVPCGGYTVWGEARGRRLLLKLCRGGGYSDPASFPQGLCGFEDDPVELVESARPCFSRVAEALGKGAA